ncbi:hypothetical protein GCM10010345_28420 [Streptomyces canarius]|uniref:Uncharacterized protein n=1 Tax=Streptomyces canarius TaxID=285453 RepID=A0ABQ3CP59_9ACTN|nr:hypothetical protein GCM10010345_28420 [Streptomyces canarius]
MLVDAVGVLPQHRLPGPVHGPCAARVAARRAGCFCLGPGQAARTRQRVLQRAAQERALVDPAHFGGAGAVEVREAAHGFSLHRWAA